MRTALWLAGLFTVAVVLALLASNSAGSVTVFWPPYRIDLSINLACLLLVLVFALLYIALRGARAMLELPQQARRWRAKQRERVTHELLLEAIMYHRAGRFLRARKAAEAAIAGEHNLQSSELSQSHRSALRVLSNLAVAESAHELQDVTTRERYFQRAIESAAAAGAAPELRDGALLAAARWALHDREPIVALNRLRELPVGVHRRLMALRLKLKAARLANRPQEALETVRLLGKHGAFSPDVTRTLVRSLVIGLLEGVHDSIHLQQAWGSLDSGERAVPELALRAAQRLIELGGNRTIARQWLEPAWENMVDRPDTLSESNQLRLVRVLEVCMTEADDSRWLARIEQALQKHPRCPLFQYLAGVVYLHHKLWGKAQVQLGLAVCDLVDTSLRRNAWRHLAVLAEQRGDEDAAKNAWEQAALT